MALELLRRGRNAFGEILTDFRFQSSQESEGVGELFVSGKPHPEPEFCVVLEQRIRPRRTAALGVPAPGRGRQVAAVDRRAPGRIRDDQARAEELRQQRNNFV